MTCADPSLDSTARVVRRLSGSSPCPQPARVSKPPLPPCRPGSSVLFLLQGGGLRIRLLSVRSIFLLETRVTTSQTPSTCDTQCNRIHPLLPSPTSGQPKEPKVPPPSSKARRSGPMSPPTARAPLSLHIDPVAWPCLCDGCGWCCGAREGRQGQQGGGVRVCVRKQGTYFH